MDWAAQESRGEAALEFPGAHVDSSAETLDSLRTDFGHLDRGRAVAQVAPRHAEAVLEVVEHCRRHPNLSITVRGTGLGQSGQSVPVGGIALSTHLLDTVHEVDVSAGTIRCGAGATFRSVLQRTLSYGLAPYVLPMNPDISVGGLLSAGGIGATSHRFGPAAAHVKELQVVTGRGEIHTCSRKQSPEVRDAFLGGLGRCGVITEATLQLRAVHSRARSYFLLYDDLGRFLADQHRVMEESRVDSMEGFCTANVIGSRTVGSGRRPVVEWMYGVQVSFDYEDRPVESSQALSGLNPHRIVADDDTTQLEFTDRYAGRFAFMKRTSAWHLDHPWFEAFLPAADAQSMIEEALDRLPVFMGDGHRIMFIAHHDHTPPFVSLPSGKVAVAFAVLPVGIPGALREESLAVLKDLHERCMQQGAKRYLSGWLPPECRADFFEQQLGARYALWHDAKQRLDPDRVFRSALFNPEEIS